VRPGSLVQPNGNVLVTVTQIDPTTVAFTLPEKELAGLQAALQAGDVPVRARVEGAPDPFTGKLIFVDNAVDSASATIRVKAAFANADARLWPGMFVNVSVAPRTLVGVSVVPAQAVQTGPDSQFVYVVGEDRKVTLQPVTLVYVESGFAVVSGVAAGARVVVEGAQNLRPGSLVTEADRKATQPDVGKGDASGAKTSAAHAGESA
jgi:RND family efflux transporter MFP subunit